MIIQKEIKIKKGTGERLSLIIKGDLLNAIKTKASSEGFGFSELHFFTKNLLAKQLNVSLEKIQ